VRSDALRFLRTSLLRLRHEFVSPFLANSRCGRRSRHGPGRWSAGSNPCPASDAEPGGPPRFLGGLVRLCPARGSRPRVRARPSTTRPCCPRACWCRRPEEQLSFRDSFTQLQRWRPTLRASVSLHAQGSLPGARSRFPGRRSVALSRKATFGKFPSW